MAIIIRKRASLPAPDELVTPANDVHLLTDNEQLNFVRALARQHARRDHAMAISQGTP